MMRLVISVLLRSTVAIDPNVTAATGYSILLIGDWGGDSDSEPTTKTQLNAAKEMANVADQLNSQFVLLLGDNFYNNGVSSSTTAMRFQSTFENCFTESAFDQMPFFAVAGNHDHRGDANLQVDYHLKGSGRWNMPALNYNIDKTLPDGKTLRIVMFDSVELVGQNYFDDDGSEVVTPPKLASTAAANWNWLEQSLKEFNGDYLFTAAHYPVHSGCSHGSVLKGTKLDDFMEQYNVNGHLAGHDHCLEHITENGQQHVLSGAGSDNWYSWSEKVSSKADVEFHMASDNSKGHDGGFTELSFSGNGGKFTYYANNGDVLFESDVFVPRSTVVQV